MWWRCRRSIRAARAAGARSPFELLREAVGEHGIEAKSISTADGDYGQMLVSRCPFNAIEVHDITHADREPRRAIEAEVHCGHGKLRVVATHFGLSLAERRTQARRLVAIARRHTVPTVMLGDFNDWFWPGSLRDALEHELPARTRHATFPSWCPLLRLDRIFCWPPRDPAAQLRRPQRAARLRPPAGDRGHRRRIEASLGRYAARAAPGAKRP